MLMRSGVFTRPRPLVEFDCGSQSTSSVLTSAAASEAARLMAVVVLPTPPFWLATAMTRPMILFSVCCASEYANAFAKSMPVFCAIVGSVSRETLIKFQTAFARAHPGRSVSRGTLWPLRSHVDTLVSISHLIELNRHKCGFKDHLVVTI